MHMGMVQVAQALLLAAMSRSERIPPVDPDRHRPGDRVLVSVVPRRPRQSAEVIEVRELGRGVVHCLVRLQDGRELVRQHSELRRSGWQPRGFQQ